MWNVIRVGVKSLTLFCSCSHYDRHAICVSEEADYQPTNILWPGFGRRCKHRRRRSSRT